MILKIYVTDLTQAKYVQVWRKLKLISSNVRESNFKFD